MGRPRAALGSVFAGRTLWIGAAPTPRVQGHDIIVVFRFLMRVKVRGALNAVDVGGRKTASLTSEHTAPHRDHVKSKQAPVRFTP